MRDQVARNHHDAGGILVQPVHDAGARYLRQPRIPV